MYKVFNWKFGISNCAKLKFHGKRVKKSSFPSDLLCKNSGLHYVGWISTRLILLQSRAESIDYVARKILKMRKILSKQVLLSIYRVINKSR